ncbi:MAG: RrF2 family transcriptional regulator [Eubacterium sp.]
MKLSKKSRYGIAALIDLAIYQKEGRVALNNIAERNKISLQYLEQVFAALRRNKIVKSIKGAQGGYLLAKDVKDITVAEIIDALDGTYKIENEEGESVASHIIQDKIVDRVNDNLDEILTNITLRDLLEAHGEYIEYNQNMYYI